MKQLFIKHDVNSMKDSKILSLRKSFGMEGYGVFWSLLEILFNENGELCETKIPFIAWELRVEESLIKSILDSELFIKNENLYYNNRINETLNTVESKSVNGTKAIKKRWDNHRAKNTSGNTESNTSSNTDCITSSNTDCNTDKIREDKIREDKSRVEKNNKPIGGFEKLLRVFPPTKVYSEHECLAIWDSFTQEEKQKVIKHSSVYIRELTKKNETQFIKNLKSYLESRIWENVSSSNKKTDLGRGMTKYGIDGNFIQWVAKLTETSFDNAIKDIQTCDDEEYVELFKMYELEKK